MAQLAIAINVGGRVVCERRRCGTKKKAPVASKRMAGAVEVIEDDTSTRYNESNVPLTCLMALRDNETR